MNSIKEIKRNILKASMDANEGHIGSSFSVLDILYVLYEKVANISPELLEKEDRDRVILSKGHASLAHAAILAEKGFISFDQLYSYCSSSSILGGHLSKLSVPGVEVSTGSLGHGISVSVGIALALKIRHLDSKVFCIVGDGEINDGTFWESLLLIAHHDLRNLKIIIDYNHSNDRALKLDPLEKKLLAFGFEVLQIDGHSHSKLEKALSKKPNKHPITIIADTIKGKGIKELENNPAWHNKSPTQQEYKKLLKELED